MEVKAGTSRPEGNAPRGLLQRKAGQRARRRRCEWPRRADHVSGFSAPSQLSAPSCHPLLLNPWPRSPERSQGRKKQVEKSASDGFFFFLKVTLLWPSDDVFFIISITYQHRESSDNPRGGVRLLCSRIQSCVRRTAKKTVIARALVGWLRGGIPAGVSFIGTKRRTILDRVQETRTGTLRGMLGSGFAQACKDS